MVPDRAIILTDADGTASVQGVVPGLLWAFFIRSDGTSELLSPDAPLPVRHDGWFWLHLNLSERDVATWLEEQSLPTTASAMMTSRERHQQMHSVRSCVYGIIEDRVRTLDGVGSDVGHLRFIMTDRELISGRHQSLNAPEQLRHALEVGSCRLSGVASLLELIVGHVADALDEIAESLTNELDAIEERLANGECDLHRQAFIMMRRQGVRLHRQLTGLRNAFHRLERQTEDVLEPQLLQAAGKLAQRLDALDHDVLGLRERGQRLQEEFSDLLAERANRHLYTLSILNAVFLPATLVTGIFGMNTKDLPLTDTDNGFLYGVALMGVASLLAYLAMRRSGFLK